MDYEVTSRACLKHTKNFKIIEGSEKGVVNLWKRAGRDPKDMKTNALFKKVKNLHLMTLKQSKRS